jgi:hypothetical protein
VAKDYGVRAGQYRKSYLSILLVLDRRVSSGRYGGYRWVSAADGHVLELVSERELSKMAQIDPEAYFGKRSYEPFSEHTYARARRAAVEDRERWGLT